jgi:GNAT superfamily N-acetyltransferase
MIAIENVDPKSKADVRRFLNFPFKLYRGHQLWVPPILLDAAVQLNPEKHPFYEHSEADFFLAIQDSEVVGRIALLENKPYNKYHDKRQAQFYLFECVRDLQVAEALFERAFEWARERELESIIGPKGFSALDGYGMLVDGFEHRPAMTMMNYNPPYYPEMMESLGFRKEVDFISCYLGADRFFLPERVHRIAERAAKRSGLSVLRFRNKKEMRMWAPKIGKTYNQTFINNWEYQPLTEREIKFLTDNILGFVDPKL